LIRDVQLMAMASKSAATEREAGLKASRLQGFGLKA
jgi:hypothetical protein